LTRAYAEARRALGGFVRDLRRRLCVVVDGGGRVGAGGVRESWRRCGVVVAG
jgi:hypothetical protein